MRIPVLSVFAAVLLAVPAAAANIDVQMKMSKPVTVTGTPQIGLDVGGAARTAAYLSGSGTDTLLFRYAVQSGDFDPDGISVISPLSIPQGSSITDAAGNVTAAGFADTANIASARVQTYGVAWDASAITASTAAAASFTISGAPAGTAYSYVISSDGGTGTVSGSGTTVAGSTSRSVDVSSLRPGTLRLAVTLSKAGQSGAAREATVPASGNPSGILDALAAAPSVALSVRQLRAAYTGPLLDVRRSSDNATASIYPTIGGDLDVSALATFCASTSCFVSAWYDQSGNGRDATQTAAASQPRIVNSGVIESLNSRPALSPRPGGTALMFSATMSAKVVNTVVSASSSCPSLGSLISTAGDFAVRRAITPSLGWRATSGGDYPVQALSFINGGVPSGTADGAALIPQASDTPGVLTAVGNNKSDFVRLFVNTYTSREFVGSVPEFIAFPADLSTAARQALERNQGSYFGITVQ